jgi:cell pole-organizing protein PopZ
MAQKDEPSMEEILSSIKRIIAEDSDAPAPPAPPRRAREVEPEPDVLELEDAVFEPEPVVSVGSEPEPEAVVEDASAEEAPALAAAPVAPAAAPVPATEPAGTLLSRTTAEATRQALASLSKMVVKPEDPVADNTLEGLVRELLRPMLKDWLDANLPRIVQATVDREVARITGRG